MYIFCITQSIVGVVQTQKPRRKQRPWRLNVQFHYLFKHLYPMLHTNENKQKQLQEEHNRSSSTTILMFYSRSSGGDINEQHLTSWLKSSIC